MKKNAISILFAVACIMLSGCGAKFSCTENIEGIQCEPPSKVYQKHVFETASGIPIELKKEPSIDEQYIASKMYPKNINRPLRVPPKIIKIWIAPWEDADGDLHSGEEIYCELAPIKGRWIVGEQIKSAIVEIENASKETTVKETNITEELPEKITVESKEKLQKEERRNIHEKQPSVRKTKE